MINSLITALRGTKRQASQPERTSPASRTSHPGLYQPLTSAKNIRLFTLFPSTGELDDHLVGTLSEVSLEASIEYDALSYVWGDASVRSSIAINGISFEATTNLISALKHLRPPPVAGPRVFWIDVICINQQDEKEKEVRAGHDDAANLCHGQPCCCMDWWSVQRSRASSWLLFNVCSKVNAKSRRSRTSGIVHLHRKRWSG